MLLNCENVKKVSNQNQLFPAETDLVLLYEEKQRRQKQLLGKIVDLIPSQDGQLREAKVLLGMSSNTVDRPVNRLYLLETNFKFVLKDPEQSNVSEDMKEGACRPKREAT